MNTKPILTDNNRYEICINNKPVRFFYPEIKSIKAAILSPNTCSLAKISKELGEKKVLAILRLYLIDLDESINLNRGLSKELIDNISIKILEMYPRLTLADVYLVFNNAKTGVYGDLLTINMPRIMKWFASYHNERMDTCEEINIERHMARKYGYSRSYVFQRNSETNNYDANFNNFKSQYILKKGNK